MAAWFFDPNLRPMSYAITYPSAFHAMPAPERRFGYSVVASTVVHGLAIIALASVRPTLTLSPNLLGLAGPLQVQLNEQTAAVIEPLPEPMVPLAVPRLLPTPEPLSLEALISKTPVLVSAASGSPTSQPLVVRWAIRSGSAPPPRRGSRSGSRYAPPAHRVRRAR